MDLDRGQVVVRGGKGDEDRVTVLPYALLERLAVHRDRLRELYQADRQAGLLGVWLPKGLEHKWPRAGESWEWQWFFPSCQLTTDPRTGLRRRHQVLDATFPDCIRSGARIWMAGCADDLNRRAALLNKRWLELVPRWMAWLPGNRGFEEGRVKAGLGTVWCLLWRPNTGTGSLPRGRIRRCLLGSRHTACPASPAAQKWGQKVMGVSVFSRPARACCLGLLGRPAPTVCPSVSKMLSGPSSQSSYWRDGFLRRRAVPIGGPGFNPLETHAMAREAGTPRILLAKRRRKRRRMISAPVDRPGQGAAVFPYPNRARPARVSSC